jgi:hypothetical protein
VLPEELATPSRDKEMLEIPFHSAYHILHIFKIRQVGCAEHTSLKKDFAGGNYEFWKMSLKVQL